MKLVGTVILYEPPKNIFQNIQSYIDQLDHLYIFDNSTASHIEIPKNISQKSTYFHSGKNEGISKRLNQALVEATKDKYEMLLTMDQDSSFEQGDLEKYKTIAYTHPDFGNIAMFGIRYYPLKQNDDKAPAYNKLLITSGGLLNIEIANKLGGFDENLFIDGVDTDFCLKAFQGNYKTVLIRELSLKHELGEEKTTRTLLLKKEKRKFHQPTRLYYIIRNHLYLRNKYPHQLTYLKHKIVLNEIKNCLLYANNFIQYIRAILKSIYDFKKGKFGGLN